MARKNFEEQIAAALAGFNAGFKTKVAKKEALAHLGYAYEEIREEHGKVVREAAPGWFAEEQTEELRDARAAYFNAIYLAKAELPFYLHEVRPRHIAEIEAKIGKGEAVEELVALRAMIAAAEVVKIERVKNPVAERVERKIEEIMAARREGYERGIRLGELLGGLPVHANTHWVVNQYGHQFLRTFYYLAGKLTALQVIVAAYDELVRTGKIVEKK